MYSFTTVVSGLPRSGTSMVMQMLAAGGMEALTDGARAADADNPRGYFEFELVKALPTDHRWLDAARGKAVKVIHHLLPRLPDDRPYRVLFLDRDLDEVLMSQAKMLARSGKPGAALPAERLKAVFQQDLARIHTLLASKPNFQVLRMRHAELISSPLEQARAINAFLGGTLDEGLMAAVVDRSLHRNKV